MDRDTSIPTSWPLPFRDVREKSVGCRFQGMTFAEPGGGKKAQPALETSTANCGAMTLLLQLCDMRPLAIVSMPLRALPLTQSNGFSSPRVHHAFRAVDVELSTSVSISESRSPHVVVEMSGEMDYQIQMLLQCINGRASVHPEIS